MSGDLIGWILAAIVGLLGIGGLYAKGRKDGRTNEQLKQDKANRVAKQKHDDLVNKAKAISDVVGNLPDADAEQRLRDKYTRD